MTATAQPVRHVEHCMGTVFTFDVRAPGVGAQAIADAVAWLHHVDETFSTYRPESVVSRLRAGTIDLAQVSDEVGDVLAHCADLGETTDGYFSAYPDGALDPSGYVKGWAIQRASDLLVAAGSANHCVNGGGDVQCVGEPEPGRPWQIGIADPHRPAELIAQVAGGGAFAVATSGTAERGHHVVDPHTGRPVDTLASVTVVGTSIAVVDALATAALAMGSRAREWLADRQLSALVVGADGSVWNSSDG